jgi:hypothetical protein
MTDTCVHMMCDRPQRARRLCERHYMQLKRAGLGELERKQPRRAQGIQLDAQLGQNSNCVNCGRKPWGGGMRCWPCFKGRVAERADSVRRSGGNVWDEDAPQPAVSHSCRKHEPAVVCYVKCGCRCGECRRYKSDYAREKHKEYR